MYPSPDNLNAHFGPSTSVAVGRHSSHELNASAWVSDAKETWVAPTPALNPSTASWHAMQGYQPVPASEYGEETYTNEPRYTPTSHFATSLFTDFVGAPLSPASRRSAYGARILDLPLVAEGPHATGPFVLPARDYASTGDDDMQGLVDAFGNLHAEGEPYSYAPEGWSPIGISTAPSLSDDSGEETGDDGDGGSFSPWVAPAAMPHVAHGLYGPGHVDFLPPLFVGEPSSPYLTPPPSPAVPAYMRHPRARQRETRSKTRSMSRRHPSQARR